MARTRKSELAAWAKAIANVAIAAAILFASWCGWRWFEGYRASIWAEEMRRAGVVAPEGPR